LNSAVLNFIAQPLIWLGKFAIPGVIEKLPAKLTASFNAFGTKNPLVLQVMGEKEHSHKV
jgi:hypothetical protein